MCYIFFSLYNLSSMKKINTFCESNWKKITLRGQFFCFVLCSADYTFSENWNIFSMEMIHIHAHDMLLSILFFFSQFFHNLLTYLDTNSLSSLSLMLHSSLKSVYRDFSFAFDDVMWHDVIHSNDLRLHLISHKMRWTNREPSHFYEWNILTWNLGQKPTDISMDTYK